MEKHEKVTEFIREGEFLLEIQLNALIMDDDPWSPYYDTRQVIKIYKARKALLEGDLKKAAKLGKLFKIIPVDDSLTA